MVQFGKVKCKIVNSWKNILDYVFPRQCFGCKKEGEYLCSACFDKIEFVKLDKCFLCKQSAFNGICETCRDKTGIDKIIIATSYNNCIVGNIVESFKYNFVEDLGIVLSKIVERQLYNLDQIFEVRQSVFVPIPLHKKRLTERGFNQSEKLIQSLSDSGSPPMAGQASPDNLITINNKVLKRIKHTSQQAKLSRDERLLNMHNAFEVNLTEPIPENVVLVDDVLTTGATFTEAAKVLKKAGVEQITCLAVCHD